MAKDKDSNGFDFKNKRFICPNCGIASINTDYCYRCDYLVTDEEPSKDDD